MLGMLRDNVLVDPLFDPSVSRGGIIIPSQAQDRCDQGIVKYVGPDVTLVKPGDYVIFGGYNGTMMKLEGEGLTIIVPEDKIIAIVDMGNYNIPGLWFKDNSGIAWECSYELAMTLITKAASETDNFRRLDIKNHVGLGQS